jgi:plastocyanin
MRSLSKLSVLAVSLSLVAVGLVACGDDDAETPAPTGTAGSSAGGSSAGGSSAGGSSAAGAAGTSAAGAGGSATAGAGGSEAAGAGGAAAGAGGAAAGAGGAAAGAGGAAAGAGGAAAGAGGAAAGAGGAAGAAAFDPQGDLAGCTFATATDGTAAAQTIAVGGSGFVYTPKCLKVKAGATVTFDGNSAVHPLAPFTTKGTLPNPIPKSKDTKVTVTFPAAGAFGYYCENHGGDGSTAGMVGAIYVTPLAPAPGALPERCWSSWLT